MGRSGTDRLIADVNAAMDAHYTTNCAADSNGEIGSLNVTSSFDEDKVAVTITTNSTSKTFCEFPYRINSAEAVV